MLRPVLCAAAALLVLTGTASAQTFPSVGGTYICKRRCQKLNGIAKIVQQAPDLGRLTVINEVGAQTKGYFIAPNTIETVAGFGWQDLTATISRHGNLHWQNKTVWVKR